MVTIAISLTLILSGMAVLVSVSRIAGGFEHPHFTKPEAMRVMRALNNDFKHGIGDGTWYEYLNEVDSFVEHYGGDAMDCVSPDIFGMYEMGIDMSWVLA